MRCPYCQFLEDRVLDSRMIREGTALRRRRECLACGRRFTTYETAAERSLLVIKKDGRREPFARQKIERGLLTACSKRPVSAETIERLVDQIERDLHDSGAAEVRSEAIGEQVMTALKDMDPVAYIRFASVYRDFQDVGEFRSMIADMRPPGRRQQKHTRTTLSGESAQ